MDFLQWQKLMNELGFENNELEFHMIKRSYAETHRKYHNSKHIEDCLQKCALNKETESNQLLILAIWYHDIVYKTLKKNNELKSAIKAREFMSKQSASQDQIQEVQNLIMATLHNKKPNNRAEAFIMDIDISILGSDPIAYEKYAQNIRQEYRLIPWFIYKNSRLKVLERFLKRETLFFTEYFQSNFERNARRNINEEILKLK